MRRWTKSLSISRKIFVSFVWVNVLRVLMLLLMFWCLLLVLLFSLYIVKFVIICVLVLARFALFRVDAICFLKFFLIFIFWFVLIFF